MESSALDNMPYSNALVAANFILERIPEALRKPHVAIVCGSGLGALQHTVHESLRAELHYEDIPHFPKPTVAGHEGKLVFGLLGDNKVPVLLLVGRVHFYEGLSMSLVTFATRVCRCIGIRSLILTNAAGGLNPSYNVGDMVLLSDHLNLPGLSGAHPLLGPNDDSFGPRFPPLSDAYDLDLRRRAHAAWRRLHTASPAPRSLHEGVYAFVSGPTYETRVECRMLRALGADVVGMSTVPEVIVARHAGMRVLAASLVTNKVVLEPGPRGDDPAVQGLSAAELDALLARGRAGHEEVVAEGARAAEDMVAFIKALVEDINDLRL